MPRFLMACMAVGALVLGLFWIRPASDVPDLRVAVASNFAQTARVLARDFERETGLRVEVIVGASGKHLAQIEQGAPYDMLLSADSLRPYLLEQGQHAVRTSRFTYALGRLAAWTASESGADPRSLLTDGTSRIAMANPRLAPYGEAAESVLSALASTQGRVIGENVSQAFQFAASGNADVALVSLAQVRSHNQGRFWEVPDSLYAPIVQQGIVLVRGGETAMLFRDFLSGARARDVIESAGYGVPGESPAGEHPSATERSRATGQPRAAAQLPAKTQSAATARPAAITQSAATTQPPVARAEVKPGEAARDQVHPVRP